MYLILSGRSHGLWNILIFVENFAMMQDFFRTRIGRRIFSTRFTLFRPTIKCNDFPHMFFKTVPLRPCTRLTYISKMKKSDWAHSQYQKKSVQTVTYILLHQHSLSTSVRFWIFNMKLSVVFIVLILLYCTDDVRGRRGRGRLRKGKGSRVITLNKILFI